MVQKELKSLQEHESEKSVFELFTNVSATMISLLTLCWFVSNAFGASFSTKGSKVFDPNGNWIVFRGIGLTCTAI